MPYKFVPMPKLADVQGAIDSIDAGSVVGPRVRTILRLQLAEARPVEVAALVADDIGLPASATLRSLPNLTVTVVVAGRKDRRKPLYVHLDGNGAQDAKRLWQASDRKKDALFTTQEVRDARKTLRAKLGHPVNAHMLRLVATLALYEKVALSMRSARLP